MVIKMWQERAQAKAPRSDPEYWGSKFKAGCMEEEILELRAEVRRLQQPQVDAEKVRHALRHAQISSRLLMDAHRARPETWLGFYDDALVHSDMAIASLDTALLPLRLATPGDQFEPQTEQAPA